MARKFKIGDKVVVGCTDTSVHYFEAGTKGTITSGPGSSGHYTVHPDKGSFWVATRFRAREPIREERGPASQIIHGRDLTPVAVKLPPLETALLSAFREQGSKGLSAMDALRALGVAGASFTKRVSTLRRAGFNIAHTSHKDPITGRVYGRYALTEETI